GLDLEFLEGRGTFSADVYRRNTNNLLFDPRTPAAAGSAAPPIVNIGKMRNNGIDFSIGYRSSLGAGTLWSVTFNGSHYRNKILQIDNLGTESFTGPISLREQNPVINMIGEPIGAFYGLVADGYYKDSLDAAPFWDDGARPGRIKFKDLNGDGTITGADRASIATPHRALSGGLDPVGPGRAGLCAGGKPVHHHRVLGARSSAPCLEHFRGGWRHPRPVPWCR